MERDVDNFLEQVRSSESLLQKLQQQLQTVNAETSCAQTEVNQCHQEAKKAREEAEQAEQDLAKHTTMALLLNTRLAKSTAYKEQITTELQERKKELAGVKRQLAEERESVCTEVSQHLASYGLNGDFFSKKRQEDTAAIEKIRSQCSQLMAVIERLRKDESILNDEMCRLADVEDEMAIVQQQLEQPLEERMRLSDLQQELTGLEQRRREGQHLVQLRADIADAEEETTRLRAAAGTATAEMQKLEQLLWFSRMERMKQRMKCQACTVNSLRQSGQKPVSERVTGSGKFGASGMDGFLGSSLLPDPHTPVKKGQSTSAGNTPYVGVKASSRVARLATPSQFRSRVSQAEDHESEPQSRTSELGVETPPAAASNPEDSIDKENQANPDDADDNAPSGDTNTHYDPVTTSIAPASSTSTACPTMAGDTQLAQRRWRAHQARMLARRQAAVATPRTQSQAAPPSARTAAPAHEQPPLASVSPLPRMQASLSRSTASKSGACSWGAAASSLCGGPKLSYRGPQPTRRSTKPAANNTGGDFRSALYHYQQGYGAVPRQPAGKRVRFSADLDEDVELLDCEFPDDDIDDFQ